MKRVIIVGSPRSNGRSAHLAEMLFEANIDERPEDELFLVPISEIEVGPCIGCNACRELSEVTFKDDDGQERTELRPRCVFDDDMQTLYDLFDDADELTVVSPIYFSGAPALIKCALDRMQPYFWADTRKAPKRPLSLHVVGEGGDPHGFAPLVSEVKSSLACAGFRLERIYNWVGKINENGEITAEAEVEEVAPAKEKANAKAPSEGGTNAPSAESADAPRANKQRPRLDLSSGRGKSPSGNASAKKKPSGKSAPNRGGSAQKRKGAKRG